MLHDGFDETVSQDALSVIATWVGKSVGHAHENDVAGHCIEPNAAINNSP